MMKLPFVPYNNDAAFDQTRRRLPHREQAGCTYFITWRLADSVPRELIDQWRAERDLFLKHHPVRPWPPEVQREYDLSFERRLERWSDEGYGACLFRDTALRSIVTTAFHHFDQQRYDLESYVVMPNHVHVLTRPYAATEAELDEHRQEYLRHSEKLRVTSLAGVLKAWKGFTSREVNRSLGKSGTLWMDESFDHAVRSEAQLQRFKVYIRENPSKAGLSSGHFSWWQASRV